MIQEDTFTKDRVANNSVILNASNDTVNEVVQGIIDEGNELYGQIQSVEQENYYKSVLTKRNKDMRMKVLKFQKIFNYKFKSLDFELEQIISEYKRN